MGSHSGDFRFGCTGWCAVPTVRCRRSGANYYIGSLRFDHVESGVLFLLPTPLVNILSHFGFYKIAERMLLDPVTVALACHRVAKLDWSSSDGSDDFLSYDFSTGTVQGYPAETNVLVKLQKVDDGPVVSESAPVVDVNWFPVVARKTISEVEQNY